MHLFSQLTLLPHPSGKKRRIVGYLVTQKDLVDPATYLGVSMYEYSKRNVSSGQLLRKPQMSELVNPTTTTPVGMYS